MRTVMILVLTSAAFSTIALSQATKPAATATASAATAGAPKVALKAEYKPGDSWLVDLALSPETAGGPDRTNMNSQTTMEMKLDIVKGDKAPVFEMTLLRARTKAKFGNTEKSMDTDNPGEQQSPDMAIMMALKECRLKFAADENGKISYVEGLAPVVNAIRARDQGSDPPASFQESISRVFVAVVTAGTENLPSVPVAVGDSWDADSDISLMGISVKMKGKCTLKEIEDTPEGKIARIEISGTAEPVIPAGAPNRPAAMPKIELEGQNFFSFSKGLIVRSEMRSEMEMNGSMPRNKITTKTTFRPADKSASSPATTQATTKAAG